MNNKNLIKIERFVSYIIITLSFIVMVALIIDSIQILIDPSEYSFIVKSQFDVNKYIIKNCFLIICSIIILGFSLWRLIKPNKILRLTLDLLYLALIIGLSLMYYNWYLDGFDHL